MNAQAQHPRQHISILVSAKDVSKAVERVARQIAPEIAGDADVTGTQMVTIMLGGLWFSTALQRSPLLDGHIAREHRVRAQRTMRDGKLGPVRIAPEFEERVLPELANAPVLLVDDILDEGKTLQALAGLIAPVASSLQTAVLIRRTRPEGHAIEPDYVGLETDETGWLVGCGMDSEGRYRDLPYIGIRGIQTISGAKDQPE
ncbi:MAG: hypothetical protein IIB28_03125 [Chloroflexi bacterium]|nr:hypothetical protein [Chloroflexota bacterium]